MKINQKMQFHSSYSGNKKTVDILLKNGAHLSLNARDKYGVTPLMRAGEHGMAKNIRTNNHQTIKSTLNTVFFFRSKRNCKVAGRTWCTFEYTG